METKRGFRNYIVACCSEAPLSWRKASVAMTILLNLFMLGALAYGVSFTAYPTAWFIAGTAFIAFLDVAFIFPYKLWKANCAEIDILSERLRPKMRLTLDPINSRTVDGFTVAYLQAHNDTERALQGVEVKIEEVLFQPLAKPDVPFATIDPRSRVNMSWCFKANGDERKYSSVELQPGPEMLDFISGPQTFNVNGTFIDGFRLRVDKKHGAELGAYFEPGIYKFTNQISGLDAGAPKKLTTRVDWDGKSLTVIEDNISKA